MRAGWYMLMAKEELTATHDQFQNFFTNTLEGIFQTSPEGELLAANPALAHIFGYGSPEEMIKRMNNLAAQAYVDPKRRATLLRVMGKKGSITNFESQIYRKDGSTLWVKENVWTVRNKKGEILYFEGTLHDISVRKKAEEAKEKLIHERIAREEVEKIKDEISGLYKKAQEGIRVRDEFLNIASHELRTPLTSLQLQIQLLQRMNISDLKPSQIQYSLDASEMQIKRLAKLINNLLDVSRINDKKLLLEKEITNLSEIIKDVLVRFDTVIKASGSHIIFANGKSVIGTWDKLKIDQVVSNLISNAIKYGEGKPISISLDKRMDKAEVVIKDNGIGIKVEDRGHIFDRFSRPEHAKKHGGLGLELFITQQIITAHGGSIQVKSSPRKGAAFIVRLPLEAD